MKIPDNPADALRQLVGDGQVWVQRSKAMRKKLQSKSACQAVKGQAVEAAATMEEISSAAAGDTAALGADEGTALGAGVGAALGTGCALATGAFAETTGSAWGIGFASGGGG